MKPILLSMLSTVLLHGANDTQSIVTEVAKLRQKYEECRQGQCTIKGIDPEIYEQCRVQNRSDSAEIVRLHKRIAKLEQKLKKAQSRLNEHNILPKQLPSKSKTIDSTSSAKIPTIPLKENDKISGTPKKMQQIISTPSTVKKKRAYSYRMRADAPIFDGANGHEIDHWEARRSFTAGEPSDGWIKITGYFVDRVWKAAGENENLWVRESDAVRR